MNSLSLMPDKARPWWREPMVWLVAGLPMTAVVAGLTTVLIASRNADDLVKEGYVKEGMTVGQILDQDRAAARLGLSMHLLVEDGALTATLKAGTDGTPMPALLLLTMAHTVEASRDTAVVLKHVGGGVYRAKLPDMPAGKRILLLESHEFGWRLKGSWDAPFSGTLDLIPPRAES
jgi:hypothetical protein